MKHDILIIGGGIVGICCAVSALARGLKVHMVEPGEPGQQTSAGNAGIISPWSIAPQATPGIWKKIPGLLMSPARPLSIRPGVWPQMLGWGTRFLANSGNARFRALSQAMAPLNAPCISLFRQHLAAAGENSDLVTDSYYVHVFRDAAKANLKDLEYSVRREAGADITLIGPAELKALEPALGPGFEAAIVIRGQARARSPGRLGQVLAGHAEREGMQLTRARVQELRRQETGWRVETEAGPIEAGNVVMAAGAWSGELLRGIISKLPMVSERGYHGEFPQAGLELNHSVMDVENKVVASSMETGVRIAGTAEFAAIDARPDPKREALFKAQARALCPDIGLGDMRLWMGRRPSLPDSLPALGPVRGQPGLYAAFGHSHYGLMMAPKTGEIIADLLSGRDPGLDLAPYDPLRFS
ncbi:D-amino-acid dehydrogenase [Pseudooceanicola antarcticus]|uniref:D-amino-acid dehydrogenase n=1 Tax=Pseudooceanicola antarcticus TaxID=1247613 RepID=A0A285J5C2_9RHOB|nr:FAD-dependent oxidoreductase [Pseudooceanicola antarcticus]PJE26858.1 FAD-dependent oxidoreductase [Pseudooceanicola antarcticus]SNY55540.1 D-amino-acid dehydrogenase [Pseudooceanicola antarcticus]